MKKIYIAGPDVFEKNATDIGNNYKKLCIQYGFKGLYPLDNNYDINNDSNISEDIYLGNIELIQESDIIIANLNSFRGKEIDSGTAFEVGYGVAFGKEVYGYISNNREYIDQFNDVEKKKTSPIQGIFVDMEDRLIEDFGNPFNLMISHSIKKTVVGGFEDVLKYIIKKH